MARRALIIGTGVADRIALGLPDWELERAAGRSEPLDLVVWADYAPASLRPRPLAETTAAGWHEACDHPLRTAIDLTRAVHPRLAAGRGTIVFVVPLMASAGGSGYAALATVGEGVRILAKSLAKTWGGDGITAHAVTLDPHAFLAPRRAWSGGVGAALAPLGTHPLAPPPLAISFQLNIEIEVSFKNLTESIEISGFH